MELSATISIFCKEKCFDYLSIDIKILTRLQSAVGDICTFLSLINLSSLYSLLCNNRDTFHNDFFSTRTHYHTLPSQRTIGRPRDTEEIGASVSRTPGLFHFLLYHSYLQVAVTNTVTITEASDSSL